MDETSERNRRYEIFAWGALFLWAGLRDLLPGLPNGSGLLGVAAILLGLNAARLLGQLPIGAVSTALGAMSLCLGAAILFFTVRGIPVDLPFFPVLLAVIGICILASAAAGMNKAVPRAR
jgi:hypothetical protein